MIASLAVAFSASAARGDELRDSFVAFCKEKHPQLELAISSGVEAECLIVSKLPNGRQNAGLHNLSALGLETHAVMYDVTSPLTDSLVADWHAGQDIPLDSEYSGMMITNSRYRYILRGREGTDDLKIENLLLQAHTNMHFVACPLAAAFSSFQKGRTFLDLASDPSTKVRLWESTEHEGRKAWRVAYDTVFFRPETGEAVPSQETVLFDAEFGHCLEIIYGSEAKGDRQKDVFVYDDLTNPPTMTMLRREDEVDKDWQVRRRFLFRNVREAPVSQSIFTLSHYGFPEPFANEGSDSSGLRLILSAAVILIMVGLVFQILYRRSQSRAN